MMIRTLLAVFTVVLTACDSTNVPGPAMRPGQDCGRCHGGTGEEQGPLWAAAGTIYAAPQADANDGLEGVTVTLTDDTGRSVSTTTNEVGNFWFDEDMQPPFTVELSHQGVTTRMGGPAPSGYCAACHTAERPLGPPGRVFISAATR
jgi:mono/diheme cytochrome c family protein